MNLILKNKRKKDTERQKNSKIVHKNKYKLKSHKVAKRKKEIPIKSKKKKFYLKSIFRDSKLKNQGGKERRYIIRAVYSMGKGPSIEEKSFHKR